MLQCDVSIAGLLTSLKKSLPNRVTVRVAMLTRHTLDPLGAVVSLLLSHNLPGYFNEFFATEPIKRLNVLLIVTGATV